MFKNKLHLSVNEWVGVLFILCIPIINIITLIIWALDKDTNTALRNLSRGIIKFNFILIIIIGAIAVALNGKTSKFADFVNLPVTSTSTITNVITSQGAAEQKIKFSNVIVNTSMGIPFIDGEVTNEDTKPHSFSLIISFYDENKKLIGTAQGVVNNINAGDTKAFSATSVNDVSGAKSYKASVDTLIQ